MTLSRVLNCLVLTLLIAAAACAGELTGKWTGTFEPLAPDGSVLNKGGAFMDLKLSGQTVTGGAGPSEEQQHQISNGKLVGNKLTFDLAVDGGSVMKFDLVFDGDSIQGKAAGEHEGQPRAAKVELKRKQ